VTSVATAYKRRFKYSEDEERDDHGRWTSGGDSDVTEGNANGRYSISVETEPGLDNQVRLDAFFGEVDDARAGQMKLSNVVEIGDTLYEKSKDDPALATQLGAMGEVFILTAERDDLGRLGYFDEQPKDLNPQEVGARYLADQLQSSWATSATDSNPNSLAVQLAAADKFGTSTAGIGGLLSSDMPIWAGAVPTYDAISSTDASRSPADMARTLADSPGVKAYVDTVYERTQSQLKDAGISGEVSLYRGMGFDEDKDPINTDFVASGTFDTNPLSSFTTSGETAGLSFGNAMGDTAQVGYMLTTTVESDRIWSMPTSGSGCLNESECILIGGPINVTAENTQNDDFRLPATPGESERDVSNIPRQFEPASAGPQGPFPSDDDELSDEDVEVTVSPDFVNMSNDPTMFELAGAPDPSSPEAISNMLAHLHDNDEYFGGGKSIAAAYARRHKSFGDPGNTQERVEGGRFGAAEGGTETSFPRGELATQAHVADMNPQSVAAFNHALEEHGVRVSDLKDEIEKKMTPDRLEAAKSWYPQAGALARELSSGQRINMGQAVAAVACLSGRCKWETANGEGEVKYARSMAAFVEAGRADGLSPKDAVAAWKADYRATNTNIVQSGANKGNPVGAAIMNSFAEKAMAVMTGSRSVEDVLTENKQRSFYDNIMAPGRTDEVTVDTHMVKCIENVYGTSKFASDDLWAKNLGPHTGPDVSVHGVGYIAISEAVRQVADAHGVSPDVVQAAYWLQVQSEQHIDPPGNDWPSGLAAKQPKEKG